MSCCGCNRTPCVCVPRCETDCPEIVDYTFTNVNLAGVGVYSATVSQEVQFRGIRSTNGNLTVAANAGLGTVDLTISDLALAGTKTFANAASRALTIPDFQGQLGVQLDTSAPYISTGTNAGDWDTNAMFVLGVANTPQDGTTTTIDLRDGTNSADIVLIPTGGVTWTINSSGLTLSGGTINNLGQLSQQGTAVFHDTTTIQFGATLLIDAFAIVNFSTASIIQQNGIAVSANSVLTTSSTAGELSSALIDTFVSEANVQTYGLPSGTLDRTTFASFGGQTISNPPTQAEVQAIDDALVLVSQRLAALITDLMATLKPHA